MQIHGALGASYRNQLSFLADTWILSSLPQPVIVDRFKSQKPPWAFSLPGNFPFFKALLRCLLFSMCSLSPGGHRLGVLGKGGRNSVCIPMRTRKEAASINEDTFEMLFNILNHITSLSPKLFLPLAMDRGKCFLIHFLFLLNYFLSGLQFLLGHIPFSKFSPGITQSPNEGAVCLGGCWGIECLPWKEHGLGNRSILGWNPYLPLNYWSDLWQGIGVSVSVSIKWYFVGL